MTTVSARFELCVPAVAGGALPGMSAELRLEALVGQLRRAWHLSAWLRSVSGAGDYSSTRRPKEKEKAKKRAEHIADALFGRSGDQSGKVGQGAFLFSLTDVTCEAIARRNVLGGTAVEALLGAVAGGTRPRDWALWEKASGTPPGFTLRCRLRPTFRPDESLTKGCHDKIQLLVQELCHGLELLGLAGGFGVGSRRGFGSLRLVALSSAVSHIETSAPAWPIADLQAYRSSLSKTFSPQNTGHSKTLPHAILLDGGNPFETRKAAFDAILTELRKLPSKDPAFAPWQQLSAQESFRQRDGNKGPRCPSPVTLHVHALGSEDTIDGYCVLLYRLPEMLNLSPGLLRAAGTKDVLLSELEQRMDDLFASRALEGQP